MSNLNSINPDNIINQLMGVDPELMKENLHLRRTGVFQSRTVTVGGQECSVEKLISTIGKRIKDTDVEQDGPHLDKLKAMLSAVSEAEKENRSATSSLFHLFSKRDSKVDKLMQKVESKIEKHKAFEALKTGHKVTIFEEDDSDLAVNLEGFLNQSKEPHKVRIFVNFEPDSNEGDWTIGRKNAQAQEVLFYIQRKDESDLFVYVIALANDVKNGNVSITAQDVFTILENRNK